MGQKIPFPILMQALKGDSFFGLDKEVCILIKRIVDEASPPYYRYGITGMDDSHQANLIRALCSYGKIGIYPTPEYPGEDAFSDPDWAMDEIIFEGPGDGLHLSQPASDQFLVDWNYCAIDADELKNLLRRKKAPLPHLLFPSELDNSERFHEFEDSQWQALLQLLEKLESIDREMEIFGDLFPTTHTDALSKRQLSERLQRERQGILASLQEVSSNPPKRKPPTGRRHKEQCRRIAERKWKENPTTTIAAMIRAEVFKIGCEEVKYTDKTLREWIKDLCPDRRQGRRPNR